MTCPKCACPASVRTARTFSDEPKGGSYRFHCFAHLSCGCTVKEVMLYDDAAGWAWEYSVP